MPPPDRALIRYARRAHTHPPRCLCTAGVNGTSNYYGSQQLYSHVTWWRCASVPHKCTGSTVRYADFAKTSPPSMNMANTPHFRGSMLHTQVVTGRRYVVDPMTGRARLPCRP